MIMAYILLASASISEGVKPDYEQDVVSGIGENIFEKFKYEVRDGVVISKDGSGSWFLYSFKAKAGDEFEIQTDRKKFIACGAKGSTPCLQDDDVDGVFDQWSVDNRTKAFRLKLGIPYTKVKLLSPPSSNDFRWTVTYLGVSNDGLKLSYREFSDGFARQAFTEDYSVPLGAKFPQVVSVKGVRFEVKSVDGAGLRYRVLQPVKN